MTGNVKEKQSLLSVQLDNGKTVDFDSKEFTGFVEKESNWHAHVLITTRRFLEDGSDLGEKARDLMPKVANGRSIPGPDWGKLWTDHQLESRRKGSICKWTPLAYNLRNICRFE